MNRVTEANALGRRARTFVAVAVVVACGLAAYSNSFTRLFVGLDGKESIRDNPHIRHVWPLSEALSLPMWKPPVNLAEIPAVAHRPTFSLSLALTNYFFGSEPPAHHAVNLAIHIAAALVLFGIIRRTLGRQAFGAIGVERSNWLGLAVALIWLVHPLQTESVTYIVQRAESLMGLLYLLTLYCAIRAGDGRRRAWWQTGAVVACVVGAGCKPTGAFAPLLVVLYDYTFASQKKWSRPAFYAVLMVAAWAGPLSYAGKIGTYLEQVRPLAYALTQPAVVVHYLRLTLWPDDLYLYVNTALFAVDSPARAIAPAAFLLALLAGTLYAIARRHWLGFVGGWFFVTLGPTSSFLAISDVIQEHRMYLPLAAPALLAVVGGALVVRRVSPHRSARERGVVEAVLLAAVVLALGVRTYVRNWDYHHEFTMIHLVDLYEDYTILADHYLSRDDLLAAEANRSRAILQRPDADARDVVFAHFIVGLADARDDKLGDAVRELREVLEAAPGFAYAHHQLGIVLRDLDDPAGAIAEFREAIRLKPNLVYARKELAVTLESTGDLAGAEKQLGLALAQQPGFGEGLFELGLLALRKGNRREAADHFREAVRYRPDLVEPRYELGMLEIEHGDRQLAREQLSVAVRLRPEYAQAHEALGVLLARLDRPGPARRHLLRAAALMPADADAHNELGILLRQAGRLERARRHIERAVALQPDSADFRYQLGRLLVEKHQRARAIAVFRDAIARNPDHFEANKDLGIALAEDGELSAAVAYLERAVELRPDDREAARRLADLKKRIPG